MKGIVFLGNRQCAVKEVPNPGAGEWRSSDSDEGIRDLWKRPPRLSPPGTQRLGAGT